MCEFEPDKTEAYLENEVFNFVHTVVLTTTGKPLSTAETAVLQGSWENQKYSQIAVQHGYTADYLKNDVGPQLWRRLSQAFGEKVGKTNLRAVLLRKMTRTPAVTNAPSIDPSAPSQEDAIAPAPSLSNAIAPSPLGHNLPPRQTRLVDRQTELKQLLNWLSFESSVPHMGIVGIGGVGKTALLLEVAYRCWQGQSQSHGDGEPGRPLFDAIVFTSAQVQRFTPEGILPRLRRERTLQDILRALARTLQCPEIPSTSFEEAWEPILQTLTRHRTLLLIDNLDTLEEQQDLLGFIHELPGTVKVLISSRRTVPFPAIALKALPQIGALQLIQYRAEEQGIHIDFHESHRLYRMTGGIPAAIGYAVSQRAMGYELQAIAPQFIQSTNDFAQFYFESAIQPLVGKAAGELIKALALFVQPPLSNALMTTADIQDTQVATRGLAQLQQLSLIQSQQGRFSLLPLTRGYILHQLAEDPMVEQTIRSRWVAWCVNYAQTHGGKDWREWQDYEALEQEWDNLTEAIEWCIEHHRYEDVCLLWRSLKCYTYSQRYRQSRLTCWDSPLNWLNWLIPEAQMRQDWAIAAEMLGDRAWKLTLMGQPQHLEAAGILFPQAWELRPYQTLTWQIELAIHTAAWHLEQAQFQVATHWLDQAQTILDQAQFGSSLTSRHSLLIRYYRGEIYYKMGRYGESACFFQQITDQAQAIGWQRARFLAKDFLADIAIQQGQLDQAQQLLVEGLQVAEAHHDQCSQAYTKRSLAQLERQRGNYVTARQWGNAAKDAFEHLGMLPEAEETQTLLRVVASPQ